MSGVTEADLQAVITDALGYLGYEWHHETDSRRSSPGLPDLIAVHPRTGALLFIELKSEKGRVRPEQRVWADALGVSAADYYLWRPSDVDHAIDTLQAKAGNRATVAH